jgi:putative tryptophan/tyrosine transport system substrate-binding protein
VKRREFISLLGGAAAAWPLSARAQQSKGPARLGFLPIGSPRNTYDRSLVEAFQQGLRQVGLIENRNIVLDVVWVGDDPDQAVSEELQRGAELLITSGSSVSVAARRQTSTIPIVFLHVGDPTAMGLIESLSRPGRNATGFSDILADLSGKFVDLATELTKPQTTIDMPDTFTTVHRAKIATLTAQYRLPAERRAVNCSGLVAANAELYTVMKSSEPG